MDGYTKIENKICPKCNEKMEYDEDSVWLDRICNHCGLRYTFEDDMGPGTYTATSIESGRTWKEDKLSDILEELEVVCNSYDDTPELWKAYNLIKEEFEKVKFKSGDDK